MAYDLTSIKCEVLMVTPDLASEWLRNNTINRPLDQSLVERYVVLMKEGKWLLNGKTIVIDEDGFMRNGQHRCHAAVVSGIGFPSVVISNVSRNAFSNLGEVI